MRVRAIAVAGLGASWLLVCFAQSSPEALLGAAIHQQEAEGNLEAAIGAYQSFLKKFGSHRALAAKAQLRLADCYRTLGRAEARSAYERVISQYADQPETAALARSRLAALRSPQIEVANRRLFALTHYGYFGATSPDERFVTYFEISPKRRGLVLREIATGRERLLSAKNFVGRATAFSPDSRVVAFQGFNGLVPQVRLVNTDGTGERVLYEDSELFTVAIQDWSPDGREILARLVRRDQTVQLATLQVPAGEVRVRKTLGRGAQPVARYSPDGSYIAYTLQDTSVGGIHLLAADGSRESEVAEHPARDLLVGWARDGRLVFASERRGRAELMAIRIIRGVAQGAPEPLRRQIPDFSALTGSNTIVLSRSGSLRFTNFREQSDSYMVELDPSSGVLRGSPRPLVESTRGRNQAPVFSPDGRHLAVLTPDRAGWAVAVVPTREAQVERLIPVSGLRAGYLMQWSRDGRSLLIDGEDASLRRGVFQIDLEGKVTLALHLPKGGVRVRGFALAMSSLLLAKAEDNLLTLEAWNLENNEKTVLREERLERDKVTSLSPSGRRMIHLNLGGQAVQTFTVVDLPELRSRDIALRAPLQVASEVAWGPDDRTVFVFVGPAGRANAESRSLWRVSLEDGDARPVGEVLLPGADHPVSVHPSGAWITFSAKTTIAEYWATEPLDLR